MCWRDDVVQERWCEFCGQEYYGDLGHENCPAAGKLKEPDKDKEVPETLMHWSETETGKELVEKAFKAVDLPEVDEKDLEPGTYTNRQLAKMIAGPGSLVVLLMRLPGNDPASKRSILSFAVEKIQSEENTISPNL